MIRSMVRKIQVPSGSMSDQWKKGTSEGIARAKYCSASCVANDGYPSRSTYHNWCKQAREHGAFTLDVDVLTRISAILGIHQGLGILFPTEQLGVEWLRTPHNALVFGGRPPLDLVTSGSQDGLLSVRRFLDGARGGLYMQPNTIDEAFKPYDDTEIVFR
jgi:hypothetical protein